ncbi:MAG: aminotransferase class I/II-fold pyridoxal phosphate-dependent enzyme [Planctomycetota bacterium]|nr:aminotransferase class I/II-fold pyridoxal phosphate-dependent enzyme [Planctomycetota bacterium]
MKSSKLADRMSRIDASGIRKVFELASKIEDPINLSIGLPDFDAPEQLKQAAIRAIEKGMNRYTVTQGEKGLQKALKKRLIADKGVNPDGEIMITSGVSGGIFLAFLTLLNPGDEILLPDPYFVIYKHVTRLLGATPVYVDTYPDFRLCEEDIRPLISEKTKLIVVNTPSNPTGVVYSKEELEMVSRLAAEHDILVLGDEIYDEFIYDEPPPSIASMHPDTLLLGGFSKTYAITGWRLGYAYGPPEIISEMTKLQQYTFVCAPSIAQHAVLEVLDSLRNDHLDAYRAKRDLIYNGLRSHFEVEKPGGAFYIFPRVPAGTDMEFVETALKERLLIIPGSVFSEKDTHFRISFAATNENLERGIKILKGLV